MSDPLQIQISTSGDDEPSIKQVFEDVSKNIKWTLKLNKLIARMKKSEYDEYMAEGFSDQQAMFLIK